MGVSVERVERSVPMSFIEDRKVSQHGLDYYATPDWATEALFDIVPEEWFDYDVWECACGEGHIFGVNLYPNGRNLNGSSKLG